MMVISGSAKGSVLCCREGLSTRPTSDKAREALFDILSFEIRGKSFLDLFSGTGAVAIEALSRGAGHAALVDSDRRAVETIKINLKKTRLEQDAALYAADALAIIELFYRQGKSFEYIFLDPPYKTGLAQKTIDKLYDFDILAEGGRIIAEIGADEALGGKFEFLRERRYGSAKFLFFGRPQ
jgi:16S rRNA (guanine(966)-N(2))-methyltransferase RsmD